MAEPDRFTLEQVRTSWGRFVDTIERATGPIPVYRSGQDTPYIVGLPPALYDQYRAALKLPNTEPLRLVRADSSTYHVDWTEVGEDVPLVSLDSRAARSTWGTVNFRVDRGLHVIVIKSYPAPGRRAAVLVPPTFAEDAVKRERRRRRT